MGLGFANCEPRALGGLAGRAPNEGYLCLASLIAYSRFLASRYGVMRLCVFADDDAKAEAHKKVSEVLGGTLTVTCQDGVEVWTVRNSYQLRLPQLAASIFGIRATLNAPAQIRPRWGGDRRDRTSARPAARSLTCYFSYSRTKAASSASASATSLSAPAVSWGSSKLARIRR